MLSRRRIRCCHSGAGAIYARLRMFGWIAVAPELGGVIPNSEYEPETRSYSVRSAIYSGERCIPF